MHFFNSNFYYNAQIGAKYFPANDGKTNITAMASIGSAPETAVLDYALPGSFSHTNTMVGLGGQYMVNPNITIGLMGTWNTYYNQTNTVRVTSPSNQIESISTRYKNLYNIYAQVYISFRYAWPCIGRNDMYLLPFIRLPHAGTNRDVPI